MEDLSSYQECLIYGLSNENDIKSKKSIIQKYLDDVQNLNSQKKPVPDFKKGLEWINVTEPLHLETHLKGKIVILDFFTYCCINCMHILPDLKALEQQFSIEDGLVVVGVHSPKFSNEKETANVASAVARYEIAHAVVSDPEETMWKVLDVCCWPTLIVLDPEGKVLLNLMGEGHRPLLELFIGEALAYFGKRGELSTHRLEQLSVKRHVAAESPLRFPGKVVVHRGQLIAIADTGNHRVIVSNMAGQVQHIIGGTQPGSRDGSFNEARFWSVQGIAFHSSNKLYIADTENHTIREADLDTRTVRTVAGTGKQGSDREGGKQGLEQVISSPWDVCMVNDNVLLIAMAGTHQIWALFLEDTTWWKNKKYKKDTCACVAGNGREQNSNNAYPMSAAFAQPSGVALAKQLGCVFVADSESSTVRRLDLADGRVSAVVGGALDPKNLFSFGDVDGTGLEAKLQHPLGVAWSDQTSNVYVADSYNHKIKSIDPTNKKCTTYGDFKSDLKLNEPGGLCVYGDDLYIADTNNHRILVVDTKTQITRKLDLKMSSGIDSNLPPLACERSITINSNGPKSIVLRVKISPPTESYFPSEKMIRWEPTLPSDGCKVEIQSQHVEGSKAEWKLSVQPVNKQKSSSCHVIIVCSAPLCSGQTCSSWKGTFKLNIIADSAASSDDSITCDITHEISL